MKKFKDILGSILKIPGHNMKIAVALQDEPEGIPVLKGGLIIFVGHWNETSDRAVVLTNRAEWSSQKFFWAIPWAEIAPDDIHYRKIT